MSFFFVFIFFFHVSIHIYNCFRRCMCLLLLCLYVILPCIPPCIQLLYLLYIFNGFLFDVYTHISVSRKVVKLLLLCLYLMIPCTQAHIYNCCTSYRWRGAPPSFSVAALSSSEWYFFMCCGWRSFRIGNTSFSTWVSLFDFPFANVNIFYTLVDTEGISTCIQTYVHT